MCIRDRIVDVWVVATDCIRTLVRTTAHTGLKVFHSVQSDLWVSEWVSGVLIPVRSRSFLSGVFSWRSQKWLVTRLTRRCWWLGKSSMSLSCEVHSAIIIGVLTSFVRIVTCCTGRTGRLCAECLLTGRSTWERLTDWVPDIQCDKSTAGFYRTRRRASSVGQWKRPPTPLRSAVTTSAYTHAVCTWIYHVLVWSELGA